MKVNNEKIDFNFWYNKNFNDKYKDFNQQDAIVTFYYKSIVSPFLRLSMDEMVDNKKWCVRLPLGDKNSNKESSNAYSCEADYHANVRARFDPSEFNLHYAQAKKLFEITNKYSYIANIANIANIDFDETLKDDYLFSDKSVTTYTYFSYHGYVMVLCEKE
ncbi:MAG: hypothetical protein ACR5LC_04245 [Symbiopectobacterium sp.]|uniref:hypothetical protein n=1 Tax=Symbiopectobacterium sp. TaxID=2952789 RepID=UPI003F2BFBFC